MPEPRRGPQIEGLFEVETDGEVCAYELWGSGSPDWLLPAEAAEAVSMGANRRAEFAAGRQCARQAIADLGVVPEALLSGDERPPIWPHAVHGSISHTKGYCVAAVARIEQLGAARIGLDAEMRGRVQERLWRRLFTPAEQAWLRELADPELVATVMFSVKEAFYKAQYPLTRAWVGFEDVRVEWAGDELVLHRVTELAALDAVTWPVVARWATISDPADTGSTDRVATAVRVTPSH